MPHTAATGGGRRATAAPALIAHTVSSGRHGMRERVAGAAGAGVGAASAGGRRPVTRPLGSDALCTSHADMQTSVALPLPPPPPSGPGCSFPSSVRNPELL